MNSRDKEKNYRASLIGLFNSALIGYFLRVGNLCYNSICSTISSGLGNIQLQMAFESKNIFFAMNKVATREQNMFYYSIKRREKMIINVPSKNIFGNLRTG